MSMVSMTFMSEVSAALEKLGKGIEPVEIDLIKKHTLLLIDGIDAEVFMAVEEFSLSALLKGIRMEVPKASPKAVVELMISYNFIIRVPAIRIDIGDKDAIN